MSNDNKWYEDRATLTEFVLLWRALGGFGPVECSEGNIDDVMYFIEKPWKWTPEYEKWISLGAPNADDPVFCTNDPTREPYEVLQEESPTTPYADPPMAAPVRWRLQGSKVGA